MEVQQLFDEPSEHVLTLPHLIQGPKNKNQLHQETGEKRGGKNTGDHQYSLLVICTCQPISVLFVLAIVYLCVQSKNVCVCVFCGERHQYCRCTDLTAFVSRQAYR